MSVRARVRMRRAAGLVAAIAAVVAGAPAVAGARAVPDAGQDWRSYVLAPPSRKVSPAQVLDASSAVANPGGLLASGGGVSVLRRELTAGQGAWPAGASASASSQSDADHGAGSALDGNLDTAWAGTANPSTLTISSPSAVRLPGITLEATTDGYPTAFTVDSWDGSGWVQQAAVSGNSELTRAVRFAAPVSTTQVRISITQAWAKPDYPINAPQLAHIAEVVPGLVSDPYLDLDFGKDVVGRVQIGFTGASRPAPELRIATSETRATLQPRSDYTRTDYGTPAKLPPDNTDPGPGTDQVVPRSGGQDWVDENACQAGTHVCATGIRAFRYMRIYLGVAQGDAAYVARYGQVRIDYVRLNFTATLGTPNTYKGYFLSSDDLLNRAWYASTYTTELTTTVFDSADTDPRGCVSSFLQGKVVYEDGAKRDRCWYGGGSEMQELATYLSNPDPDPIRNELIDAAIHQDANGNIPGSPCCSPPQPASYQQYPDGEYWVRELFEYVVYSGDLNFARTYWPNLVKLLDTWMPGLISGDGTALDSSYWSTRIATELRQAAILGDALGGTYAAESAAWRQRADNIATAASAHLWDPTFGGFLDAPSATCHELLSNALAITGGIGLGGPLQTGIATSDEASAFQRRMPDYSRPSGYANDEPSCSSNSQLVYGQEPAEAAWAAFSNSDAQTALDDLRRTYGWQLSHDPYDTLWEGYANGTTAGFFGLYFTSMAHNLMVGAAADLTNGLLGVTPTGIGFDRVDVVPHPGDVAWTQGRVPTPHGPINVSWRHSGSKFTMDVTTPAGTTTSIGVPTFGHAVAITVNGRTPANTRISDGFVYLDNVPRGEYSIVATEQ